MYKHSIWFIWDPTDSILNSVLCNTTFIYVPLPHNISRTYKERNSNVAIRKICYARNESVHSSRFTFLQVYISVIHKGIRSGHCNWISEFQISCLFYFFLNNKYWFRTWYSIYIRHLEGWWTVIRTHLISTYLFLFNYSKWLSCSIITILWLVVSWQYQWTIP